MWFLPKQEECMRNCDTWTGGDIDTTFFTRGWYMGNQILTPECFPGKIHYVDFLFLPERFWKCFEEQDNVAGQSDAKRSKETVGWAPGCGLPLVRGMTGWAGWWGIHGCMSWAILWLVPWQGSGKTSKLGQTVLSVYCVSGEEAQQSVLTFHELSFGEKFVPPELSGLAGLAPAVCTVCWHSWDRFWLAVSRQSWHGDC